MARWLKVLLGIALLMVLAVALLPWWLGAALRPAGRAYGLEFERYERRGYGRFALHEAKFERDGLLFTARRAEIDTPLRFVTSGRNTRAELEGWRVIVTPQKKPAAPAAKPAAQPSVPALHRQVQQAIATLRQRLPNASARDGVIVLGDRAIEVHEAEWNGSSLRASGRVPGAQEFVLGVATPGDDLVLAAQLPRHDATAEVRWNGKQASGRATWWGQPLEFQAEFGERGWWPREALVQAREWDFPAERVRLGAQFERLRGHAELRWQNDGFRLSARAEANPRSGENVPPLRATAEASGTTGWFTIAALEVKAPFADVTLTAPLEMSYRGEMRSPPARLLVAADLARQPWFKAAGRLNGRVELAGAGPDSRGDFIVELQDVAAAGYRAQAAELRGHWQWPRVELAQFRAQLDAASHVRGRGTLDWARRELSGVELEGTVGRGWLARALPAGLTWREIEFSATASGQLEAPQHSGSLRARDVALHQVAPFDAQAEWRGQDRALEDIRLAAQSATAQLQFAGRLDETRLQISELTLAAEGAETLRTETPAEISWKPHLRLSGLRLQGGATRVTFDGELGPELNYALAVAALDAAWVRRWVEFGGPGWRVDSLRSEGRTTRGMLDYTVQLDGTVDVDDDRARVQLAAAGDGNGLRIERLEFTAHDQPLTRAGGQLPLVVASAPRVQFRLNERAPLEFDAAVAADSPLWALLAEMVGLDATGASAAASLRGSVKEPRGELRLTAPRIVATGGPLAGRLPQLTDLALVAEGNRREVGISTLTVHIEGHPLTGSGRLPMGDAAWEQLRTAPRDFALDRVDAQIEFADADITALMRSLDSAPLTQGRVSARARLSGGQLDGSVQFANLATAPLPGFGVIQDIEGRLLLRDRVGRIESFQARIGGELARASGTLALAEDNSLRLDVQFAARNLPLVRRPGLLVRTDFDLEAKTLPNGATRLGGVVRLRDTLVMADLAAILPGGPRGTARRPPYFSVPQEPFSRWLLDVAVRGEQSVRARTAVFDGVATPRFQLTGTLGDPRAIGQLNVDSGKVLFPFATFDVQSGTVRISEADPNTLRLNVHAGARRHGYELRMEADGTVDAPRLTFSSNPPLEAADVLLMVTTGQPPTDDTSSLTGQQRLTRLGTYIGRGIFKNFGGSGSEDRLEITSGEEVSREGRETYQAEYKLNERLSLTGEYDQYDAYNAGIKFRVYVQEEPRRERRRR